METMMTTITLPTHLHDEQLLTTEEVAKIVGLSRKSLERWRYERDGGPAFIKLAHMTIRYRWGTVRAWIEAGTVTTAA
jgi:predicted DNA-binding transcriptional regulator AlpA